MGYEKKGLGVGIVDNDPCALKSLANIIGGISHCVVLWVSESGSLALHRCASARGRKPDVLIVDMSLNDTDGPTLCNAIHTVTPHMVCIGVTAYPTARFRERAQQCGITQLIDKQSVHSMLPTLLIELNESSRQDPSEQSPQFSQSCRTNPSHQPTPSTLLDQSQTRYTTHAAPNHSTHYLAEHSTNHVPNHTSLSTTEQVANHSGAILTPLSPREEEIISLYAQGLSTADITCRLQISTPSVYTYQNRAIGKLHARTLTHAVYIATTLGLI